ncbi:MAG: amidohydrolase family protein [bacterium]
MIIDIHAHVEYKNANERYSPEEFIVGMDKGGIDKSIILGCDHGTFALTNFEDDEVASFCQKYADRLVGFASVHPHRSNPHLKVERAVKKVGLRGAKLYPHAGFYPNDSRLDLVYEKCMELNIPVMIHTGVKALQRQYLKYNSPIYIDDVVTRFPKLKVIMCHGGFPWCDKFLAVAYSAPNVWVDITFLDYIENAFKKRGLCGRIMKNLVEVIGPQRLLWGSEGPFMNLPLFGHHTPDYYIKSQNFLVKRFDFLGEEDKTDILGNNAARLLNIQL